MMKFIASDAEAATAKAKRALGDKAVIIAMRNLPSGDVEVTASDTPAPSAPAPYTETPGFATNAREAIDNDLTRGGGARLNETMEQRFAEDALERLKGNLASRGEKSAPQVDLSDSKAKALDDLLAPHGLGEALRADLINGAARARMDDDFHRLEVAFGEAFTYSPLNFAPSNPIMLVGPTGAGKTSSAAKLAKTAMDRDGTAFMLTADVGRAGAIEQIKTYGESLGADYFIVETPSDVQQTLTTHRPSGGVILDTPGVSPFDAGDFAALKSFQEAAQAEPVLVLPASGDAEEFIEWAIAFSEFGVRRIIITKFDATKRIGAGLCAAHAANLALSHFSETAFISEGLITASPEFLARRFVASWPGKVG